MTYETIQNRKEPAYLQLYRRLRDDVTGGVYAYGSRLPSKRVLAEQTGLSLVTVEHALALLCDEGYAAARPRSGVYVQFRPGDPFAVPPQYAAPRPYPVQGQEDASAFPVSVLTKTMRRVMSDLGGGVLARAPGAGLRELRQAIANYLARSRGMHVSAEQIVIGSGAEFLYGRIVELLGRDRVWALESPSYNQIRRVYEACDVQVEMLPLGRDGIDSRALTASQADVLHVTPYRSYPSGVTASASKRHEYIRWAHEGRYMIEDDFESEFSASRKSEETLFAHAERDNVLYLNTFSKTVSPSVRVGYMVLPQPLVPLYEERLGFYASTVPTFMQYVLAQLLDNGDFERHINRVRRQKRRETEGQ